MNRVSAEWWNAGNAFVSEADGDIPAPARPTNLEVRTQTSHGICITQTDQI